MQTELGGQQNGEPILLNCPCGKRLRAAPYQAGKRLKCPTCGRPSLVPAGSGDTASPPSAHSSAPAKDGVARGRKARDAWFFQVLGEVRGPVTLQELRKHARDGAIDRDTLLRLADHEEWVTADRVAGLLDNLAPPTPTSGRQHQVHPVVAPASGLSQSVLIALRCCVALVVVGCVLLVRGHIVEARIVAANNEIVSAVSEADAWIAGDKSLEFESIEEHIALAVGNTEATRQDEGRNALSRMKAHRDELVRRARLAEAQRKADAMFGEARQKIDAQRVPEGIVLLRKYLEEPHGTRKTEAQKLLDQAEIAISVPRTLQALGELISDAAFDNVTRTLRLDDGLVTDPALRAARADVVKRQLPEAIRRREEARAAVAVREEAKVKADLTRMQAEEKAAARARQEEETKRRSARAIVQAAFYVLVENEIDRVFGIATDGLEQTAGTRTSVAAREIRALGSALRQSGTTRLRSYLRELKGQDVDKDFQALHSKYLKYLEASINKIHLIALCMENSSLRLVGSEEGLAIFKAHESASKAWNSEWEKWADISWEKFVRASNSK